MYFSNKGDAALWAGQSLLFEALGITVAYICVNNDDYDKTKLREALEAHGGPQKTAILFHGGGNFGDLYHNAQTNRESVAIDFPDYRIRSFPQSYKFKDEKNLQQAQAAFRQHPDLQLTARDMKSYMSIQRDFGRHHKVLLLPDTAEILSAHPMPERNPQADQILFLARNDHEAGQDHYQDEALVFEKLRQVVTGGADGHNTVIDTNITFTDWMDKDPEGLSAASWDGKAWLRTNWAYNFLGGFALTLTDRFHGHILSTQCSLIT